MISVNSSSSRRSVPLNRDSESFRAGPSKQNMYNIHTRRFKSFSRVHLHPGLLLAPHDVRETKSYGTKSVPFVVTEKNTRTSPEEMARRRRADATAISGSRDCRYNSYEIYYCLPIPAYERGIRPGQKKTPLVALFRRDNIIPYRQSCETQPVYTDDDSHVTARI